jgi:hypothetical protein
MASSPGTTGGHVPSPPRASRESTATCPTGHPAKAIGARCEGHVRFGRGRFHVPLCEQHLHVLLESRDPQRLAESWCMDALYDELAG